MDASTTQMIVLKELAGHAPTSLDPLQQVIHAHYETIRLFWILAWWATVLVLLFKLWRDYRAQR